MYEIEKFPLYLDMFNLICGDKIGSGAYRDVFECRLRPDVVIKVEQSRTWREFSNVDEYNLWLNYAYCKQVARWLAPCEYISPDGRVLIQKRTKPLTSWDEIPDKLPAFLTDLKPANFGKLDNKIVCHDYAMTIANPSVRLRKVRRYG